MQNYIVLFELTPNFYLDLQRKRNRFKNIGYKLRFRESRPPIQIPYKIAFVASKAKTIRQYSRKDQITLFLLEIVFSTPLRSAYATASCRINFYADFDWIHDHTTRDYRHFSPHHLL